MDRKKFFDNLEFGRITDLKELLAKDPKLARAKDGSGRTFLHHLASYFDFDEQAAEMLLSHGANIEAKDNGGRTPLHTAAYYSLFKAVHFLLSRGASINAKDERKETPLQTAMMSESNEALRILSAWGAKLTGRDALFFAAWKGDLEALKKGIAGDKGLLRRRDRTAKTLLHYAAMGGQVETAEFLIAQGANVNDLATPEDMEKKKKTSKPRLDLACFKSPLHLAVRHNQEEMVKVLLARGAEVSIKDGMAITPLQLAADCGDEKIAGLLIAAGASPTDRDSCGRTPLHGACFMAGFRDMAELFISHGGEVNARDHREQTPLHQAIYGGNSELADFLLSKGADVDAGDKNGNTPLLSFPDSDESDLESTALLISRGARIDVKNALGQGPLHLRALYGHPRTMELLLSKGADVNAGDSKGWTPMDYAMRENAREALDLLQRHGGAGGESSIIFRAVFQNDCALLRELLKKDAGLIDTSDVFGMTPLSYAASKNILDAAEVLLQFGASPDNEYWPASPLINARALRNEKMMSLLKKYAKDSKSGFFLTPRRG